MPFYLNMKESVEQSHIETLNKKTLSTSTCLNNSMTQGFIENKLLGFKTSSSPGKRTLFLHYLHPSPEVDASI